MSFPWVECILSSRAMGMEVTVDIKEGGQMETITSYSGEEPEGR